MDHLISLQSLLLRRLNKPDAFEVYIGTVDGRFFQAPIKKVHFDCFECDDGTYVMTQQDHFHKEYRHMTRQHHLEDWQYEVANGDTTLGLDQWIEVNINDEADDGWDTPSLDTSFHDHEMDVN